MSIVVNLTESEIGAIRSQSTEGGGFQALFKKLSVGIEGSRLTIDEETAQRAVSYAENYGQGGWQNALSSLVTKLKHALEEKELR